MSELCDADILVKCDEDGTEHRERCLSLWTHLYTMSDGNFKRLCGFHYAFMDHAIERGKDAILVEQEAS
jgi:hypothetical protein